MSDDPRISLRDVRPGGHLVYLMQRNRERMAARRAQDAADAAIEWLSYGQAVWEVLSIVDGAHGAASRPSPRERFILKVGRKHPDWPRLAEETEFAEQWLSAEGLIEKWRGHRVVQRARLRTVLGRGSRGGEPRRRMVLRQQRDEGLRGLARLLYDDLPLERQARNLIRDLRRYRAASHGREIGDSPARQLLAQADLFCEKTRLGSRNAVPRLRQMKVILADKS